VKSSNTDPTVCQTNSTGDTKHKIAAALPQAQKPRLLDQYSGELPISVGDQVKIDIAGDENFAGIYEVSIGGGIDLPLLGRIPVQGLTTDQMKTVIGDKLVDMQLILPHAVAVDSTVKQWAPVEVFVRGAVFNRGRQSINFQKPEFLELTAMRSGGNYTRGRLLSSALQQAGGVRPDADLSTIQVIRK